MSPITIHNTQLPIVEYRGQRVVTLAMIDQVHERPDGTARRNFNEHRGRFIQERHFFEVTADDIRTQSIEQAFAPRTSKGVLVTERGYLMLVKAFTDDLAWEVQEQLVERYFRPAPEPAPALPADYITALEHLLASKRSEQLALEQRDEAVRTKAEIGTRREATAMATASAAVRKAQQLQEQLGLSARQATIVAVEKALDCSFGRSGWRPLKRWCQNRSINAPHVTHPTFGSVIAWPAGAWMDVYQIDLAELFGTNGEIPC